MPFKNGNTPWNKGLKGDPRNGWTQERRDRMSAIMRERYKDMGPQPHRWIVPAHLREHRYRWSRAKAQAKYWCQPWSLTWEQYVALYEQCEGEWGRNQRRKGDGELGKDRHINLARINTLKGWHLGNVTLMVRDEAMRRKRPKDAKGNYIKRRKRNEQ